MNLVLVLPFSIPLFAAAISIVFRKHLGFQRGFAIASNVALLLSGVVLLWVVDREGIVVTMPGDWPAPYGIALVADRLSAIMIVLAGICGLAVAIYSLGSIGALREKYGYYPLLHILLMGVCGAFLTGDLFNLYVWFEVMLMASFVLLSLGGEPDQLRGAIKYVTMNLVASAIFLAAVGILYGLAGTLNMADLARKLDHGSAAGMATTLGMLFFVAFGIKAAVFPLFFWLPASYHTPPVAISAIFAGMLTKVGVYAILRVFTLIFVADQAFTHWLILVIAGLTMVTGVLGAAAQYEFRRILSFHIISQIGYMIMGLGIAGLAKSEELAVLALAGSVFYITHHIIVKTNLFLVSGLAHRLLGTFELREMGGLYRLRPFLAFLFLIPAFSLSGVPPLSGFFAKLSLIEAGLQAEQYAIVAVALAVGLLTLFSMTKIWAEAFWKGRPESQGGTIREFTGREQATLIAPVAALAAVTVLIGLAAEPVFGLATRAGRQLYERQAYIDAVLGDTP